MAESASTTKPTPSWKKLLLIPVLGAVLLYVVCAPSNEGAAPTLAARVPEPHQTKPLAPSTAVANSTTGSATVPVTWPATPLADVMAFNPFQMPAELKSPVDSVDRASSLPLTPDEDLKELDAARAAELRAALKGQRLAALVKTSKGLGAIVGDAVVAVGDLVGDRLRVTAIRPEGVVLELIDKPAPADGKSDK